MRWIERIARDPALDAVVRAGLVEVESLESPTAAALDTAIEDTVAGIRERYAGLTAGQMDHLRPARELYRAIGIEPTRYRPSPEALTRRLLKGDAFPRIHPAVDLANLWAVESGLPVGLYDAAKIAPGPIALRLGHEGESYEGIRKGTLRADGRLVLADDLGPFGNPSADSLRTSVDDATRALLYVMFTPTSVPDTVLDRWAVWLCERLEGVFGASSRSALIV